MIHRCKEHGSRWCLRCFVFTAAFPVEHFLWERTPLRHILPVLGLT